MVKTPQDYICDISNKIRVGISSISSNADTILRSLGDDAKIIDSISKLTSTSDHIEYMVNDLIDYCQIMSGKTDVESSFHGIKDIIDSMETLLSPLSKSNRISFNILVGESVPMHVKTDKSKFLGVVMKLFSSAIGNIFDGSASVSVWKDHERLMVKIDAQGYSSFLMDEEEMHHEEVTIDNAPDLSVFISSSFIQMLGGRLTFKKSNQASIEYMFSVPISESATVNNTYDQTYRGLQGIKILVVDDIARNRALLKEILEDEGVQLSYADNGLQAINIIKNLGEKFDLILMDIQMPEMDGYTATKLIHEYDQNIPVIGITAHSTPKDHAKAVSNGMIGFITKPLKIRELLEIISRNV